MGYRVSKFQRGSSVYKCGVCGIMTRNTGDEGGCELCVDCFDIAGEDNHHNDHGTQPDASEAATLLKKLKNIAKKGGDVAKVAGSNSYAFPNGNPLGAITVVPLEKIMDKKVAAYVATDVKFFDCMRDGSHRKSVFARMPMSAAQVEALSAEEKVALRYLVKFGFVVKV